MPIVLEPVDGWNPSSEEVKLVRAYLSKHTPGGLRKNDEASNSTDDNGNWLMLREDGETEAGSPMSINYMRDANGNTYAVLMSGEGILSWEEYEDIIHSLDATGN